MSYHTADLCDEFPDSTRILNLPMNLYGMRSLFHGEVVTLKVFEDNSLVRKELEEEGNGRVLVVDGGGSMRCALIGDNLAQLVIDNHWSGVIVYGCIRDSQQIEEMDVGVFALGTCPRKSNKRNEGLRGPDLLIEGTLIKSGDYLYADEDGIILSDHILR